MKKIYSFVLPLCFLFGISCKSQTKQDLQGKINQIIVNKNALVGVYIIPPDIKNPIAINADKHFPLQSVFKFHLALTILSEIDKGNLLLQQKIKVTAKDLLPNLWSPLRENNPKGGVFTIAQLIEYAVAKSDNVACDVLIDLLGTPKVITQYLKKHGFVAFDIQLNEEKMQANWENMYQNWMTPKTSSLILQKFYNSQNHLLSKESYNFIWQTMKATSTAPNRIKGQLPKGTIVAHKTGTSGTSDEGITEAINDIGVVFLPNGNHFIISVFVNHSQENESANDKIIADITKAAYDFYTNQSAN